MGGKIWEVFSTKEWETFAKIFHKRYYCLSEGTEVEGINVTRVTPHGDGRVRNSVDLPHLDWVLSNLAKGRADKFPITEVKGEYHAPAYLDFIITLLNKDTGNVIQDRFDKQISEVFGSAKLINISKKERKYTVIIYGVCINP